MHPLMSVGWMAATRGAVQCSPAGHCPRHRLAYNDLLVYLILILIMTYHDHLAPHSSHHCSQQKRNFLLRSKTIVEEMLVINSPLEWLCFTRIVLVENLNLNNNFMTYCSEPLVTQPKNRV